VGRGNGTSRTCRTEHFIDPLCVEYQPVEATPRDLFASAGLSLAVSEQEMRRRIPGVLPGPSGATDFRRWTHESAPLFFRVYEDAFSDRPGFPGWDENRWRAVFATSKDFRPDLSVVAMNGEEPAGYAILWVEDGVGWITQMGVRPARRGTELGESLIQHALRAFGREGLNEAALEVATNNPFAVRLYERMGFRAVGLHESWWKVLVEPA
jgi:ribosomal protein S18 acetylase RimI-like enzyme